MNEDLLNTYLGQYHLREIIGRGGMATVYKAYQPSLDRFVAIKLILSSRDAQFVARFKREARLIARLQHPNILTVYDHGEQDGRPYLVLQYIDNGTTLTEMLGQPMSPIPALRLASHVLGGLEYAHARGIIHRDIKPSNILMASPRWPMLADFGIAKLMGDSQMFTQPGLVIGTAAYMAPEMAFGAPADVRTDIYAVGIVLYEMLTGRVPFDGDTPVAMLHQHAYEPPPPPRNLNPDLPLAIEAVMLRALAKRPEQRYQTAAEMATALEQAIAHHSQPTPTSTSNRLTDLYRAGVQAFEKGDWERAIERLRRLVTLDETNEDAADLLEAAREAQARVPGQLANLYQAGVTAFQQARWEEAVAAFSELVKLDPAYKDAAMLLEAARGAIRSQSSAATSGVATQDRSRNQQTPSGEVSTGTTSHHMIQPVDAARTVGGSATGQLTPATASLQPNASPGAEAAPAAADAAGARATKPRWMLWSAAIAVLVILGGAAFAWQNRPQINEPVNAAAIVALPTAAPSSIPQPTSTPQATSAPQPTDAPQATETTPPTATAQPSATAQATDTPQPPDAIVTNAQQRMRSGPGQNYDNLGVYTQGATLTINGKDSSGAWVQVTAQDGQVGWMLASDLQLNIPLPDLAVVAAPPSPTAPPTTKPAPKPSTKPAPQPAAAPPTREPPTPVPPTLEPPAPAPPTPVPPTPTRKPSRKPTPVP